MSSLFYSFYQNTAGQGVTGLTGTVDIYRVSKSSPFTSTLYLASGSFSVVGSGIYYIGVTGTDTKNYDYPAVFKSTGSVSSQWIPSIRWDGAEAWTTEYGYMDASIAAVPDTVWDEVLTAATHNIATSAGRRLRQLGQNVVWDGIAQGAGVNGNQIILDAGASAVDGSYDPSIIAIVAGAGLGQCRLILQYEGSTRTATVDRDWKVLPDNTSEFIIYADAGREHVNEGLAQAGGANTITLNTNASASDTNYVNQLVFIRSGTGQDQVGLVTSYNGTTKVATVAENWHVVPDSTSAYVMLPTHVHDLPDISAGVWTYATRTLTSFGTLVADIWAYVTRTLTAGGGSSAADVWAYATRTLTQTALQVVQSLTDNTQINVYKSTTFNVLLQNLPDFTGWQKMWFTVKEETAYEVPDTESIIQIQLTAPTGTASDGLLYINKDVASLTDGYLEVVSTTSLRVKVSASVTGNVPPKILYYGIKYKNASGDIVALSEGGEFVIHHSTSKKVS